MIYPLLMSNAQEMESARLGNVTVILIGLETFAKYMKINFVTQHMETLLRILYCLTVSVTKQIKQQLEEIIVLFYFVIMTALIMDNAKMVHANVNKDTQGQIVV